MEMNGKPRAPTPSPFGRNLNFPPKRKLDKIKMDFS